MHATVATMLLILLVGTTCAQPPTEAPPVGPTVVPTPAPITPAPTPYNPDVFHPVATYADIPPSGDVQPSCLPVSKDLMPYAGKKVLVIVANGAEDVEITYPYQYFTDRGATVEFLCVGTAPDVFIHDFYRPTYKVSCTYPSPDIRSFDVILIPGGMPSSSVVRSSLGTQTLSLVKDWINTNVTDPKKKRLLAVICSGVETLLESEILELFAFQINGAFGAGGGVPLTGSPASEVPVVNYFSAMGWDMAAAIRYGSTPTSVYTVRGNVMVIGQNPNALPDWVGNISEQWLNITENNYVANATVCINGTKTSVDTAVFQPITTFDQIPKGNAGIPLVSGALPCASESGRNFCQKYVNVGILVSPGAHDQQVISLYNTYVANGITPKFVCPDWIPTSATQKQKVYLQADNSIFVSYWVNCTQGMSSARGSEWDIMLVPGGLFSTHAVLRGDPSTAAILQAAGLVGLSDTAVGLLAIPVLTALVPAEAGKVRMAPSTRYNAFDMKTAGWVVQDASTSLVSVESFVLTASNATCLTCNLVQEAAVIAGRRILTDYTNTPADAPIIIIAAVGAFALIGVFSIVFRRK